MLNSTSESQQNGTQPAAPEKKNQTAQTGPNNPTGASKPGANPPAVAAQKPLVTAQTPPNKKRLVGENYTTPDLIAKVTGQSKYAEDYRADGMLFAKLLLSPYPHARVLHIDASKALAMPG